ncbi:hypothetical protein [Polyangium spumosum]|uniref:Uncharacterized protein n=1 Tax=Polyangium spumosum TaxID=889282 RepID=A0A6N7Q0N3_9BACT|nr:hypothetical protein [Polyangium spumosum]MRG97659.1 hypothetical protein [Polyangium spumosum]
MNEQRTERLVEVIETARNEVREARKVLATKLMTLEVLVEQALKNAKPSE